MYYIIPREYFLFKQNFNVLGDRQNFISVTFASRKAVVQGNIRVLGSRRRAGRDLKDPPLVTASALYRLWDLATYCDLATFATFISLFWFWTQGVATSEFFWSRLSFRLGPDWHWIWDLDFPDPYFYNLVATSTFKSIWKIKIPDKCFNWAQI